MSAPTTPLNTLKGKSTPLSQRNTPVLTWEPNAFLRQQWEEASKRGDPRNYANFEKAHRVPLTHVRQNLSKTFHNMNVRQGGTRKKRMNRIKKQTRHTRRAYHTRKRNSRTPLR